MSNEYQQAVEELRESLRWVRSNRVLRRLTVAGAMELTDLRVIDDLIAGGLPPESEDIGEETDILLVTASLTLSRSMLGEIRRMLQLQLAHSGLTTDAETQKQSQLTLNILDDKVAELQRAVCAFRAASLRYHRYVNARYTRSDAHFRRGYDEASGEYG